MPAWRQGCFHRSFFSGSRLENIGRNRPDRVPKAHYIWASRQHHSADRLRKSRAAKKNVRMRGAPVRRLRLSRLSTHPLPCGADMLPRIVRVVLPPAGVQKRVCRPTRRRACSSSVLPHVLQATRSRRRADTAHSSCLAAWYPLQGMRKVQARQTCFCFGSCCLKHFRRNLALSDEPIEGR